MFNTEKDFWNKVDKNGPFCKILNSNCWVWLGWKDRDGYGSFYYKNKPYRTHRLSFMFFYKKEIPSKMIICHHCDNPACVNPEHLFMGSPKDNLYDAMNKGRFIPPMLGKHHSKETKEKISRANKGRHLTEEQIVKRSYPRGPMSQETKDMISKGNKGKTLGRKFTEDEKIKHRKACEEAKIRNLNMVKRCTFCIKKGIDVDGIRATGCYKTLENCGKNQQVVFNGYACDHHIKGVEWVSLKLQGKKVK